MVKLAMTGASRGDGSKVVPITSQPISTIVPTSFFENSLSIPVTAFKLNGQNFLLWFRSVQMIIKGKGKFGFLNGSDKQPPHQDPTFSVWDMHNSLVMSWIIHSMEDSVAEVCLLYPTAKAIWDIVHLTYSDLANSSQMFELHNRARNLHQEETSVTDYFNSLKKLWQ